MVQFKQEQKKKRAKSYFVCLLNIIINSDFDLRGEMGQKLVLNKSLGLFLCKKIKSTIILYAKRKC
jgi:hypothetical protein